MSEQPPGRGDYWRELVKAFSEIDRIRTELIAACGPEGLSDIVNQALGNRLHWKLALELYPYLTIEDQQTLFPRLLEIACSRHPLTRQFADLVCSFPSAWLRERIELVAEPLLTSEEAYWQLFSIYSRFDSPLASRLVERAGSSADPDIRAFAAEHSNSSR